MEMKTLRNAIAYSPDKAEEFVLSLYSTLNSDGKAVLRAEFKRFFLDSGDDTLDGEN